MSSKIDRSETKLLLDDLFSYNGEPLRDGDIDYDQAKHFLSESEKMAREEDGVADTDAVVGDLSINVRGTTWSMLKALVALALALAPDPTALTKAAALGIVWDLIGDARDNFKKLNHAEKAVVTAIVDAEGQHWRHRGDDYGVTYAQIEKQFTDNDEDPPKGLEDVLKGLTSKGIVKIIPTMDEGDTYRIPL
jgi:hypothetical protein